MQPFFSIVIPSYNRANMIGKAIESVLAQTYADWELVIVDDGSKDNTKEVVAGYADKRIRYIYQDNAERSAARNNGIANAAGQYICFLDSDDYYLPSRLQLLHDAISIQENKMAVFYTGIAFEKNGKITNRPELENTFGNFYDYLPNAIIGNPQACAYRQILLEHQFNPAFNIGEDMELWLRICGHYPFIYLDKQWTVVATEHEDRSVNVAKYNSYVDQLRMLRHIFSPTHPGRNISGSIKANLLGNCYFGIAKFHIYKDERYKAASCLMKSIRVDTGSKQFKFRLNVLLQLLALVSMEKVRELIRY
jgi:glycosyltransferase involved in cell wall biosynthesis